MSKHVIVLGDSFATVDPIHGHWASMWANRRGYKISHYGHPGKDHLYIINEFYKQAHLDNIDMLIYQVTDFYRLPYQYPPLDIDNVVSKLTDLSYFKHSSNNFLRKLADTSVPTALPLYMFKTNNLSLIEKQFIQRLYSTISIEWLSSANYFIMRNLLLECKIRNIPLVIVIDQHLVNLGITSFNLFDEYEHIFLPSVDNQTLTEESINHVSNHGHGLAAESFEKLVQENKVFTR